MLIYNGSLIMENLKRASLSIAEMEEVVREHGVSDVKDVDLAVLEVNGNISILSGNYEKRSVNRRSERKAVNKKKS